MSESCSGCEEQLNKSKSLNDITGLSQLTAGPLKLKEAGRSNTCDDPTVPDPGQSRAKILSLKSSRLREENSRGWPHPTTAGSLSSLSSARSSVR